MLTFETANITDNVISWYNLAGIERQRRRDKNASEDLAEESIFLVKFILGLDLPLDTESKVFQNFWYIDFIFWLSFGWDMNV